MKYMHFNSSCSYAAIANLLYLKGIDTEDSVIAKAIHLPYILLKDGGAYLRGPMLQSKETFDIYLNSIGYEFVEKKHCKDDVIKTLKAILNTTSISCFAVMHTVVNGESRLF